MEATLQDILEARERRVLRQQSLLAEYQRTLVCVTLNVAGPVKYDPLIARGFGLGCDRLEAQLAGARLPVLFARRFPYHTGCEGFYVVDASPERVKALMVELEEADVFGRLLDLDVLSPDGKKLERQMPRKCLLCDREAHACARSRAHSLEKVVETTRRILREAVWEDHSRRLAALAGKALLYEVCTTPKPGLVDRENNGSHTDMDIFTFLGSAAVLQPSLADCVRVGMETAGETPEQTFARLRLWGRLAEATMIGETGGVNTHKGAIFTMGLLCAAVGRLWEEESLRAEAILAEVAAMCRGLTARDFGGITAENAKTAGERLYAAYGITGIRGQAEQGYPAVLHTGLPVLREGLALGYSLERAGCAALLAMLTAATDTNLIARSDRETAAKITRQVALLLAKNRYPDGETLRELDQLFRSENLSPGGTADLLAATYFLHFIEGEGH